MLCCGFGGKGDRDVEIIRTPEEARKFIAKTNESLGRDVRRELVRGCASRSPNARNASGLAENNIEPLSV